MILFAAHDPGAKNHIRPIYKHALRLGESAEFIDLAEQRSLLDGANAMTFVNSVAPQQLVCGSSANQAEWPLVRACRCLGVPAVMVVDIGPERKFRGITKEDFPDRFMVTNSNCKEELIRLGAHPEFVVVTGNAHLEYVSQSPLDGAGDAVAQYYGLTADDAIVPFFCTPHTEQAIGAVLSLASLLPCSGVERPAVIVRPHPRASDSDRLQSACDSFDFVCFDGVGRIGNSALLSASLFSLSMTSSTSLESLVMGIPSAFYQIGWDFAEVDDMYRNIDAVARIRDSVDLNEFVAAAVKTRGIPVAATMENYVGALERSWQVVQQLKGGA